MSGCAVIGKWSTFGLSPITAQWCVLVFTYCRTDLVADLGLLFIVQWPLEFNNKEIRLYAIDQWQHSALEGEQLHLSAN